MKGCAVCQGAATIITGFATGAGGAYGINLKNETSVELNDSGKITSRVNGEDDVGLVLAKAAVTRTLNYFGMEYSGADVNTETDIPVAAGLKSSSIAANSIVLASVGAICEDRNDVKINDIRKFIDSQSISFNGKTVPDEDLINIGIDAAFDAKVTATGAIDDASAAYFGGYSLTRNLERKIVYRGGVEDLDVLIYLPGEKIYSAKIKPSDVKAFAKEVEFIWEGALAGNIYQAITLNGLIHSTAFKQDVTPSILALDAGALACGLSGTGPAVVALSRDKGEKIVDAWSHLEGKTIWAKTNNEKALIID